MLRELQLILLPCLVFNSQMKKLIYIAILFFIVSCGVEPAAVSESSVEGFSNKQLEVNIPSNFPPLVYDLASNPPTEKGFELGKKLFYEGKMASDGVVACGFCHIQEFAFTHHTHIVSHGVDGAIGTRNAQPLQNLIFQKEFTWDGAAIHLDLQPIIPITTPVEMNETFTNVIAKLKKDERYVRLFQEAFENGEIDTENILKALSQFMIMMVSAESKYDKFIRNEGNVTFNEQERNGLSLFQEKCASCHASDLFTDQSYRNNGLPVDSRYDDGGRIRVTGLDTDSLKFKVPSLRNIELTFPYMHDGRFRTLENVLDHYINGVVANPNLDPLLSRDGNLGIAITEEEKAAIISFLKTLTDTDFAKDDRFSEF